MMSDNWPSTDIRWCEVRFFHRSGAPLCAGCELELELPDEPDDPPDDDPPPELPPPEEPPPPLPELGGFPKMLGMGTHSTHGIINRP